MSLRPVKLTMRAFGPYAKEQTIDFRELAGRNIFLITGPTGAGKTTIFDAICYAVYGRGSGSDRDGENMRSDFVGDDVQTEVELVFELNGRTYAVKRKPRQLKRKSRGEGYTEQLAEAELRELGSSTEVVAGVREVKEKIEQILGISYEQFRQIMMIPQGEFRELLLSESKDREAILQRIFGTEGFKKVQDRLADWEKSLREEVRLLAGQRDENIRRIETAGSEELAALIGAANLNVPAIVAKTTELVANDQAGQAKLQTEIAAAEAAIAAKQQQIFAAQQNNRKFVLQEEALRRQTELEGLASGYQAKEGQLRHARKALVLQGLETQVADRRENAATRQDKLREIAAQQQTLATATSTARQAFAAQQGKDTERISLQEQLTILKGYVEKVRTLESSRQGKKQAATALERAEAELEKQKATVAKLKQGIDADRASLDVARSAAAAFVEKKAELEQKSGSLDRIAKLKTENDRLAELRRLFEQRQTALKRAKEEAENCQTKLEELKNRFLTGQAGLLATTLKPEQACPVCGATHHPSPAPLAADIPTEDRVRAAEESAKQAAERYEQARGEYDKVKEDGIKQKEKTLLLEQELSERLGEAVTALAKEELPKFLTRQQAMLSGHLEELKQETDSLEKRKAQEMPLSQALATKQQNLILAEASVEEATSRHITCVAQLSAIDKTVADLTAELPVHLQGEASLVRETGLIETKLREARQAFETAEQQFRAVTLEYEKKRTEQELGAAAVTEALAELKAAEDNFQRQLAAAGFGSQEEYSEAKLSPEAIEQLDREIRGYYEDLRAAQDAYRQAAREVEGLTYLDTGILEKELADQQTEKADLTRRHTEIFARIRQNQGLLAAIKELDGQFQNQEAEFAVIAELANTARGNNEEKISFERYVLAAFFEDIIEAANLRLAKMTGGRYEMSRIAAKGKGTAQSGLDLEVFDNYTGRARHVKTLSGGESFKASLALALGLADVVQAYAGGISLETMFIDEGFGTLDPESLDNAVGCLVELQHSGRLVGIISHVPELKASIDARLEVEAGKDGSRARFHIA